MPASPGNRKGQFASYKLQRKELGLVQFRRQAVAVLGHRHVLGLAVPGLAVLGLAVRVPELALKRGVVLKQQRAVRVLGLVRVPGLAR